jgi:hypothetical protein
LEEAIDLSGDRQILDLDSSTRAPVLLPQIVIFKILLSAQTETQYTFDTTLYLGDIKDPRA